MSLFFSRECEYALQSVMYLAKNNTKTPTPIKEIAERLNIPQTFLAKIFQKLTRAKLLRSVKGLGGGFMLTEKADNIVPYDIITAIDGADILEHCILGYSECSQSEPCPLHNTWKSLREKLYKVFTEDNIFTMSANMKKTGYTKIRNGKHNF